MKKTSTAPFLFTLATILLVGCNKTDNDKTGENILVPIKVGAYINETRASEANWNDNDAIGITMFNDGTFDLAEGAFKNNKYVTSINNLGSFNAADNNSIIYFPKDGSMIDLMSYYPHSTEMTSDYVMPLDITDQSILSQIDLMTGEHVSGFSKETPSVKLHFTHKLSMIIVNLHLPVGEDPQRLTGSQVTLRGMYTKGNYKLINNTSGVDLNLTSVADLDFTSNNEGDMAVGIVFPRLAANGVTFLINLPDGGTYSAAMNNGLELQSGYKYTFNITLQKTPIVVTADIEEWLTGTSSVLDAH